MSEPEIGERLKAARESKGLSAQKAADELHLDVWVIEGLESGDYARLGPSVYVKGHLRRYAALLDLPAAALLERFAQPSAAVAPPAAAALRMSAAAPHDASSSVPAAAGVLIALGALAAALWWGFNAHGTGGTHAAAPPTALPATDPGAPGNPGVVAAGETEPATPDDASTVLAAATQAASGSAAAAGLGAGASAAAGPAVRSLPARVDAAPPPAAVAGRASLRLSFSADSWVDVHDAAGHRLFAGTGHANSVRTIAGEAPLSVYLGYASGVQLELNSHAVAIGRQFMAGDVARFEAGADGVLRRDAHPAPSAGPRPRT